MDHIIHPVLTIDMSLSLRLLDEDVVMSNFLQNLYFNPFLLWDVVIMQDWELTGILIEEPIRQTLCLVEESNPPTKIIEISLGKTLKINVDLSIDQEWRLMQVLSKNSVALA